MIMIVYALQAIAACFTIFGAMHVPDVTNAVVTYGVSADDAPNAAMWFNSYGSIAIGIATYVGSWIAKNKLGFTSPVAIAVMGWLKNPTDKIAIWQLFMAGLEVFILKFVPNQTADDVAAIDYIRKWATDKFVIAHTTPTVITPKAS